MTERSPHVDREAEAPSVATPPDGLVVRVAGATDLADCYRLRREVFVGEQGVPEAHERDAHDATATHFVARRGGRIAGTARVREFGGRAKVERVAVAGHARRAGVGRALMAAVEDWAAARHLGAVALNAQLDAVPFYEALGYRPEGETFLEAGLPHRAMSKPVAAAG